MKDSCKNSGQYNFSYARYSRKWFTQILAFCIETPCWCPGRYKSLEIQPHCITKPRALLKWEFLWILVFSCSTISWKWKLRGIDNSLFQNFDVVMWTPAIERFHSRDQHLCKFVGTKESVYIRKEINSHRIGLEHQHGRRFIVLEHQYGRRDVMWKLSIASVNPG